MNYLKKISWGTSAFLSFIVIMCTLISDVSAETIYDTEEEKVVNSHTIKTIDNLYTLRHELAVNFEENQNKIAEIDARLAELGVDELSAEEIAIKMGIVSPRVTVPTSSKDSWTSVRQVTVYNGNRYELQIIRAVPKSSSSTLLGSNLSYDKCSYGFIAGAKNVLKVAASAVIGAVSGDVGTVGITFYDAFKGLISGLSSASSVGAVNCSYTTSYSVEQIYVYVKYEGASDNDQVLCYAGDAVSLATVIAIPTSVEVNGVLKPAVETNKINYKVTSEGYSIYMNYACRGFYNYNLQYNFQYLYSLGNFNLELINSRISINVPFPSLQ